MPRVRQSGSNGRVRWIDDLTGRGYDAEHGGNLVLDGRQKFPDAEIIRRLSTHAQRATYEARAGCSSDNGNVRHVAGAPSWERSWIVTNATGLPSPEAGESHSEIDPRLLVQHRRNGKRGVINTGEALCGWMQTHFVAPDGGPYEADGWVRH